MSTLNNIKFHYFAFPGRGEFVQILLDDAGLDYEKVVIRLRDWYSKKAELIAQGVPAPTLPYLTIDGKYVGKTVPTMRYLSKQLGKYIGDNDVENQYLDMLSDICMEWYNAWAYPHYIIKTEEAETKYQNTVGIMYHDTFENVLAKTGGPYVLGDRISYVDFIIYHSLVEDTLRQNINKSNKYPHLKKLIDAIESRPSLKKHLSKL
ncbi:glutathione S-transferase [Backusella circina FSU 941]|nr:glutathione S-transferase [Backusella circina FSU 941]